jgi:hypothetical protein
MKVCKESGLEVWHYTEGWYCDSCNNPDDTPCEWVEE